MGRLREDRKGRGVPGCLSQVLWEEGAIGSVCLTRILGTHYVQRQKPQAVLSKEGTMPVAGQGLYLICTDRDTIP